MSERETDSDRQSVLSTTLPDGVSYINQRGDKVADGDWECPNCGDDGELMYRPGSKDTCANCFWVVGSQNNDYVLPDWPLKYRHGQQLLAERGDNWYGTPGDVGTRLRKHFDSPEEAGQAWKEMIGNGE